jgi:hypothetical protein
MDVKISHTSFRLFLFIYVFFLTLQSSQHVSYDVNTLLQRVGVVIKVKTHYESQKMLSQILFFRIVQLSTFTKPILKEVVIKYIQNKVAQLPNNIIVKGNVF